MDIVGIVVGALLGALAGYGFARYQQGEERKARRRALLGILREELKRIATSVPAYDITKAFYRDPIWLSAPEQLLDGAVLEFRKDSRLIELLLNLKVAVAKHNDFVRVSNEAQAGTLVPDNVHEQWHADLTQRLHAILEVRDGIESQLRP